MKTIFTQKRIKSTFFAGLLGISTLVNGQINRECLDIPKIHENMSSYNNDFLYPAGSVIYSSGYLDLIKPYPTIGPSPTTTLFSGDPNELAYMSWLYISTARLDCREDISLYLFSGNQFLVVDGDTITSYPYTGENFKVQHSFHNTFEILITGKFDTVKVGGTTGKLKDVCLTYGSCGVTSSETINLNSIISDPYPNPSNGIFNIDILESNTVLEVYNSLGALVSTEVVTQKGKKELSIQNSGVYFIKASSGNQTKQFKVIVN
jgi:hypothetical protein